MDNKFTIRLKPLSGESLSGYLMRVALANNVNMRSILNYAKLKTRKKSIMFTPQQIETNALESINLDKLSYLTDVDKNILESMTCISLFNKFTETIDYKTRKKCLAKREFIMDKRRFCPLCIREYKYYKLIWQVSEIEICDIHLIKLKNKCSVCHTEQSYISFGLAEYRCSMCGSFLYTDTTECIEDKNYIIEQLKKYEFWSFLLSPNAQLFKYIGHLSKEKSLAITFLYACQLGQNNFEIKSIEKNLSGQYIYKLLSLIRDGNTLTYLSVDKLANLLKKIDISIKEFSQINVPKEFIQSLMSYCFDIKNIGPGLCNFDLCTSYGKNTKMKQIKHIDFMKHKYSSVFICTACHMKYGYSKHKFEWELVKNDAIQIDIIKKVHPLINTNTKWSEIIKKTGLRYKAVSRAIGYITSHGLSPYEIVSKFIPESKQHDIVCCFEELLKEEGLMEENSKKLFNWSTKEFFYYISLPEVQEYIILNSYKYKRRKYKSDIELEREVRKEIKNSCISSAEINVKSISRNTKISARIMYRTGISNIVYEEKKKKEYEEYEKIKIKIDNFISAKEEFWEKVNRKDIYKFVGKDYKWFKAKHPELLEIIIEKIKIYNEKRKLIIEAQNIEIVKIAVEKLNKAGQPITKKNISNETKLSMYIIEHSENISKTIL